MRNKTSSRTAKKGISSALSPVSNEIWGIIFLCFGTLTLLALVSYNHADPSFFTHTRRIPSNYVGRVGANVSEALIQLLGLSAFIACAFLFSLAAKLFRGAGAGRLLANLFWHVMAMVTCATFLALVIGPIHFGGTNVSSGGWLGGLIASTLLHYLNIWGATLVTLCAMLIALVFATPLSTAMLLRYVAGLTLAAVTGVWSALSSATKLIRQAVWETAERRKTAKLIESKIKSEAALEIGQPKLPLKAKNRDQSVIDVSEIRHRNSTVPDSVSDTESGTESTAAAAALAAAGLSLLDDASVQVVPPAAKKPARKPVKKTLLPNKSGKFTVPSLELLKEPPASEGALDRHKLIENSKLLETKLTDFGIDGQVVAVRPGPVITMYEFKPGPGVKISKIAALADDLSLALSAQSVRIVAPIPGKNVVGIEIPNDTREGVFLREILSTDEFQTNAQGIPLCIGKDISGAPIVSDLARMPHLLIAGASGKGKSVFINSLICSLLYKFTPNDMRLIMVDPKQVELNLYEDIPHLLLPVVDDPKKASTALKWIVNEMERRYKIMAKSGVRNLAGFNQKLDKDGIEKMIKTLCPKDANGMPEPTSLSHLFEHDEAGQPVVEPMPTILVIIDEFADLMMTAPKDIETSVARLGQKARAAGIHLVIATQRPSVDVITGLIKANLPSRVSFQTSSKVDSRTILDSVGAEKLLGMGDMLFIPPGLSRLTRIHGAYVDEDEINKICDHWREQGAPVYREEILIEPEEAAADMADGAGDELYSQAISIVREMGQASASMLQRRLKVGYNRAARMVEAMEAQGIVGPADGARPREVIY